MPLSIDEFIEHFDQMSKSIHNIAYSKGFWPDEDPPRNAELIALMHSELSEALEALRHGNPPDPKIPDFDSYTAELADCVIRIMDVAAAQGLPLSRAIVAKTKFNETRPHKHGKKF